MSNLGDQPMYPNKYNGIDGSGRDFVGFREGLTIRQHTAIEAMKGILSKSVDPGDRDPLKMVAEGAIMFADALLKELEK